jgi:hypothetical protein
MDDFEARFAGAESLDHGPPPIEVSATPYVWRDPETIPKRQWLYGHELQRKHVSAVVAPGAGGKTTFKIARALAMVTGRPILGKEIPGGPKRVWLWNLEDDMEELARSIQAACKMWGIGAADIAGRLFVDSAMDGAALRLATYEVARGLTINEPLVDALVDELKARGIDYLDIDPFISSHSVDENDNGAIDAVVKKWVQVACRADCAISLAHHIRKSNGMEANAESARGAVAMIAACRSVLVLNRMGSEEAEKYKIPGEERRRYFRAYDDKNNRAPPADNSDWFKIESVNLGNGGSDFGDSVGAVVPWTTPDIFEGVTDWHLYQVQRLVDDKEDVRENSRSPRWIGRLIAEVLDLSPEEKSDRKRISSIFAVWLSNGAFSIDIREDESRRPRKFVVIGNRVDPRDVTPPTGLKP